MRVLRFSERYTDPAQLERLILESGCTHENILVMRGELGRHFSMVELQSLSLLDTCRLYCDLIRQSYLEG